MSLPGIFVVGTDTGVGKTRVASAIARSLVERGVRAGVFKPIATGATRQGDAWRCEDGERLVDAIKGGAPLDRVVPLLFEEPLAPSVAARRQGRPLDPAEIERVACEAMAWWADRSDMVIVEGVGGLLTPIADRWTVADLAVFLDFPLLIVARRGLGTLSHTLLTIEAAARRGLRSMGVVLNTPDPGPGTLAEETNASELARILDGVPILCELEHDDPSTVPIAIRSIDWYDRAGRSRLPAVV